MQTANVLPVRRFSRLVLRAAGLSAALALAACSSGPSSETATPTGNADPDNPYLNAGDRSWSAEARPGTGGLGAGGLGAGGLGALALRGGTNDLPDLDWVSASSGWGPPERDRSNGETGANDGRTLTLSGQTYARGLGVHAASTLTYRLGGACSRLSATVGIDDEVGNRGSVVFQVFADGTKLYDSGTLTGASASGTVNVNLAGKDELKLVVTNAGDNNEYDHADWAGARLECSVAASTAPPAATQTVQVGVPAGLGSSPFDQPRSLRVPPGFEISVYARIDAARFMQGLPNGDLLVSQPSTGKLLLVRPGSGGAGQVSTFASGLTTPHDVVLHQIDGTTYLYLAESNRISRSVYVAGDTGRRADQTVVGNLPDSSTPELKGAYSHALKNIALGPDHRLYVSVASATNASPSDTTSTPKRAAIYQYGPDGSGGRLFAQGLRNAEGLAFPGGSNDLWVVVNNRDNIAYPFHNDWKNDGTGDDYGKVIQSYVDNHPPEEFTRVRDGGNSGWPFCNPNPDAGLDSMPFDRDVQNNPNGAALDCSGADRINKGIQAHSAPLGVSFLQGSALPQAYRAGAVTALHGCWNCSAFVGHKVVFFPWKADGTPGPEQDLVGGWVTDAVNKTRWGRPVDAVPDVNGNLLISDDYAGAIYKLSPVAAGGGGGGGGGTPSGPQITSLTLIDAATDRPVPGYDPIPQGAALNLAALPGGLSVRANPGPGGVGSVRFTLDGGDIKQENIAPYVIAGDGNGGADILPWTLPPDGAHTLTVTGFSAYGATGTSGTPVTLNFTVKR